MRSTVLDRTTPTAATYNVVDLTQTAYQVRAQCDCATRKVSKIHVRQKQTIVCSKLEKPVLVICTLSEQGAAPTYNIDERIYGLRPPATTTAWDPLILQTRMAHFLCMWALHLLTSHSSPKVNKHRYISQANCKERLRRVQLAYLPF